MQLRAGGPSGLARVADDVALRHARAASHGEPAEMRIHGRVLSVVATDPPVAVAALDAGEFDPRVAGGTHTCSRRRGIVGALVRAPALLNRMAPHAEARADARELERRAQKRLAQVLAIGRVVARAGIDRAQRLALVDELGG